MLATAISSPHATAVIQVSIVVPTFRRPALLERCLAALAAQDFDPSAYEIIVADDAASAATKAVVERWAQSAPCAIHYVPVLDRHGPAAARNTGWWIVRGNILAFTDDDCIPDPDWLRAGLAAFTTGIAAVWGAIRVPLPRHPTDYERNESGLENAEFVTANCFCRRSALAAIGGFDERFTMAWREDSDLFFKLLETGRQVAHRPEARVTHPVRPARWGVSLRQQRKALFNALLYKKHPGLYRQKIQPSPPWHYYAAAAALLGTLITALMGQIYLALGVGAAWLVLTVRFCAFRLRRTSHAPAHVAEMLATSALIPPLAIFWRLWGALRFRVFFL